MNTDAHDGRPAPGSRQAFTELMDSIGSLSDQDRKRAREQADAAVLGFEAYALGQEYLERGDFDGALRWLRIAADHDVPGARRLLEDTVLRTALDRQPSGQPGPGAARSAGFSSSRTQAGKGLWLHEGTERSWGAGSYECGPDQRAAALLSAAREQAGAILAKARSEARTLAAEAQTTLDDAQQKAAEILARAREHTSPPRTPAPAVADATSCTPSARPNSMQTGTDRPAVLLFVAASSHSPYSTDHSRIDPLRTHRSHDEVLQVQLYSTLKCLRSLVPSLPSDPGRVPLSAPGWNLLYYAGHGLQDSAPTYRYTDIDYRSDGPHRKAPHPAMPDRPARTPTAMNHWKCSVETLLSTYTRPHSADGREMWIMWVDTCTPAAEQPSAGGPAPQVLPAPGRAEGS